MIAKWTKSAGQKMIPSFRLQEIFQKPLPQDYPSQREQLSSILSPACIQHQTCSSSAVLSQDIFTINMKTVLISNTLYLSSPLTMIPTLVQRASASSMECVVKMAPLSILKLASIVSHTNLFDCGSIPVLGSSKTIQFNIVKYQQCFFLPRRTILGSPSIAMA